MTVELIWRGLAKYISWLSSGPWSRILSRTVFHSWLSLDCSCYQFVLPTMHFVPQSVDSPIELTLNNEQSSHASPITVEATETSNKILDIILDYALNKFNDKLEHLAAGRPKFLAVIDQFVVAQTVVEMCLPAFPFKSANKVDKVFGILPDKAEELALERLNGMCIRIRDVHPPGAKLTVISDGLVYNGKFNVQCCNAIDLFFPPSGFE